MTEGSRVIAPETKSFTARQKEDRVLLEWRTAYEVNILGYHVYREENGEFLRMTPELVAGSALFAGNALPAGNAYAYWDNLDLRPQTLDLRLQTSGLRGTAFAHPHPPSPLEGEGWGEGALSTQHSALSTIKYWLEEISLDGTHSWCGPVAPVPDETLKIPEHVASASVERAWNESVRTATRCITYEGVV